MKIKVLDREFQTRLSVKHVALSFREGIQARPRGLTGLVASKALEWDFFTPQMSDDPFAAFDDDAPDFSAGASYGLRHMGSGNQRRTLEAGTGGAALLNVWDRGAHRDVLLRHAGDLSPASRRVLAGVVERFIDADPSIAIQETKGKMRG